MAAPGPSSFDHAACDQATLDFYADEARVYAAKGPRSASRPLAAFLQALASGARILELGCGAGRDSQAMLARGFQLDATDGVPEIAREAEGRIGRPVRVMRFDELDAVEEYDGVWAHASLLHVPRAALPGVLSLVFRALKPRGVHFASFKRAPSNLTQRTVEPRRPRPFSRRREPSLNLTASRSPERKGLSRTTLRVAATRPPEAVLDRPFHSGTLQPPRDLRMSGTPSVRFLWESQGSLSTHCGHHRVQQW